MLASGALLIVAYIGFVSLGLPDAVLGVAWPSIRADFSLTQGAMGSVLLALSIGFFLSSWNSGWLIGRCGVGWMLLVSTALMALALVGYALALAPGSGRWCCSAPCWWGWVRKRSTPASTPMQRLVGRFQTSAAVAGVATLPGAIGLLAGIAGLEIIGVGLLVLAILLCLGHEWLVMITAHAPAESQPG